MKHFARPVKQSVKHCHDIKHLLRVAQNGIEDAEALLPRFRAVPERAARGLGNQWEESCSCLETLADLSDEGELSFAQEAQSAELVHRVGKLRPDLERFQMLQPRLDWPLLNAEATTGDRA